MARPAQITTLAYAVRPRVLGKYLGQLGLALAALQAVPLGASLLLGEFGFAVIYSTLGAGVALVCWPLARLRFSGTVQANEALSIGALVFIFAAALNVPAFLYAGLAPVDAVFEAVSGVTTTGLTAVTEVSAMPATFLVARAWSQWYGGLGIVVLATALLASHSTAYRRLYAPENDPEDLAVSTRLYARRALVAYLAITAAGVVVVLLLGTAPLHAFTHVFAAVSTGGFSSLDQGIAALGGATIAALTVLSVSGAIALPTYFLLLGRDWRSAARQPEWPLLLGLIVLLAVAVPWLLMSQAGFAPREAWLHGAVLAASAQSTTGFSSVSLAGLPPAVLVLLAFGMAIGGSTGSTAGGIKLLRVLIAWRLLRLQLQRTALTPHAVAGFRLYGRDLQADDVERVLILFVLFLGLVGASWLVFLLYGLEPAAAFFEVLSATATVGLSTGITPDLPDPLKLLLCINMLAGRVEIVALLVLAVPGTWIGKRSKDQ